MPLASGQVRVFIHCAMSQTREHVSTPLAYIVDDEPMLLDLNEAVLRSIGFDVRRFRAAEIAFEAYKVAPVSPAIIITDYSMHKMTGLELIESCRKLHPGQKVLMVSGTVDASIFKNSAQKPDYFMPKPYSTERLSEAVRHLAG
jgi:two-component system, cell cycle sensor histidine kinase and response regulator CckA